MVSLKCRLLVAAMTVVRLFRPATVRSPVNNISLSSWQSSIRVKFPCVDEQFHSSADDGGQDARNANKKSKRDMPGRCHHAKEPTMRGRSNPAAIRYTDAVTIIIIVVVLNINNTTQEEEERGRKRRGGSNMNRVIWFTFLPFSSSRHQTMLFHAKNSVANATTVP